MKQEKNPNDNIFVVFAIFMIIGIATFAYVAYSDWKDSRWVEIVPAPERCHEARY